MSNLDVGSRLFCTAAPGIVPGATLAPGEFGRRQEVQVLYSAGKLNSGWAGASLLELGWEVVRLREFPHRPSRLDCLFLWLDEQVARDFHTRRPWPTTLYEVEITSCTSLFVAPMDLISYFEEGETTATLLARAHRYWIGDPEESGVREVLIDGAARILRAIAGPVQKL